MSRASSTEELWELLSDRLGSFFARRVSDPLVAEDLLQEAFVRIHAGLGSLRSETKIEPWVFRIARNLVTDHLRSAPRDEADELDPEDVPVEGDENLNRRVGGWLAAMIDRLPETYAEAVRLYELEGVPQQRIAEELGLSLSGAKSRIQRGREKLEQMLSSCCTFERDRRGNVIDFTRNEPRECRGCGDDRSPSE